MTENERLAASLRYQIARINAMLLAGTISAEEYLEFLRQIFQDENF